MKKNYAGAQRTGDGEAVAKHDFEACVALASAASPRRSLGHVHVFSSRVDMAYIVEPNP
jgi:hypothetical protein